MRVVAVAVEEPGKEVAGDGGNGEVMAAVARVRAAAVRAMVVAVMVKGWRRWRWRRTRW